MIKSQWERRKISGKVSYKTVETTEAMGREFYPGSKQELPTRKIALSKASPAT